MRSEVVDLAVKYANAGIKVFPCDPTTKQPLTQSGFKSGTTNTRTIKKWWKECPDALIGGVCDENFSVIDVDLKDGAKAFESLALIHGYCSQSNARVTTLNNGSHYYFKSNPAITRKIKVIPSVDILGHGGYTILPDDKRYVQTGSIEEFIGKIAGDKLNTFPTDMREHVFGDTELPELRRLKEANTIKTTRSKSSAETSPNEHKGNDEEDRVREALNEKESVFGEKIYERSENRAIRKYNYDGTPIKLEKDSVTTAMMNGLFYNKEIQKRMATFLGVPVPHGDGRSNSFHSLIPSHDDKNPSMGARWVGTGDEKHIVVRDFSDHFGDGKTDYNLVRLFAVKHYGSKMTHLSGSLFCMWMLKLLDEAGVIDVEYPEFDSDRYHMTKSEKKVSEGFLQLMAYKMLRKGTELETTFSQKFAAAWVGVSQSIVNSAKSKMIKFGNIIKTGKTVGAGMLKTAIFCIGESLVLRHEIRTIGELRFALKLQIRKKMKQAGHRILGKKTPNVNTTTDVNNISSQESESIDQHEKRQKRKSDTISGFNCVWDGS